jgi:predicted Fe-Mo cluster-binding NifX family protein
MLIGDVVISVTDQIESTTKIAVPSLGKGSLEEMVSTHFGESPTFVIASLKKGEICDAEAMNNLHASCFSVIDSLASRSVNVLLVTNIGARPYMAALSRGMDVRRAPVNSTIRKAIESYAKGETPPFEEIDVCSGKGHHH